MDTSTMNQRERAATIEDLDDIATVNIAAMSTGPAWDWRLPHYKQYPEVTWNFNRWLFGRFFQDSATWHLRVVELVPKRTVINDTTSRAGQVIAFALWQPPPDQTKAGDAAEEAGPPPARPVYDGPRPDADSVRGQAFNDCIMAFASKHFDSYGRQKLPLILLATLPAYHNQGAGGRLMRWGFQCAAERKLPVTVISTDRNVKRYEHWGCRIVGDAKTKYLDGDDFEEHLYALVSEPHIS